jgi:hypothetical protein
MEQHHIFFGPPRVCDKDVHFLPIYFSWLLEGLSKALVDAKRRRVVRGSRVSDIERLTHLLFIDDVLLFFYGSECEFIAFHDILYLYKKAINMDINEEKSTSYSYNMSKEMMMVLSKHFPFQTSDISTGLKYLGFSSS